jgi:hypothetical protein
LEITINTESNWKWEWCFVTLSDITVISGNASFSSPFRTNSFLTICLSWHKF